MNPSLLFFDELDSTNDYLKAHHQTLSSATFVACGYQLKGRGQFERVWQSNKNENMLISFLIKDLPLSQLELLKRTYYDGLIEFLSHMGLDVYLKEPNDIYMDGKKLAGILIETLVFDAKYKYVIVGLGLNLNQTMFGDLNAISIKLVKRKEIELTEMIRTYQRDVMERLRLFL